ncbi:hypothetical protein SAMN02787074_1305 [Chryseobacterium sp. YR221]|jgi:hypothetical protein|nr:hypothetical protein SAMN02787074_1305 [Chryseobacterium sp. YR221]
MTNCKILLKQVIIEFIKVSVIQYLGIEQTLMEETILIFEFIKNKISL